MRTLLVGDEPSDVVFAGPTDANGHFTRAFITTARRGQNLPESIPPNLTTPGTPRALVYVASATFQSDRVAEPPLTDAQLRALATADDQQVTYTCVPPGEGVRLGIDRDGNGIYDQDEIDAETPTTSPTPTESPTPPATSTPTPTSSVTRTTTPTPATSPTLTVSPAPPRTPTATPALPPGDADCNGMLDVGGVLATCTAAFNAPTAPPCGADCNDDGVVTAADVTRLVKLLAASSQ